MASANVRAQQTCGCERVAQDGKGFGATYSETDAQKIIDEFAGLFRHKPEIVASPYGCETVRLASAALCFKRKEYIFFDTKTFTTLKKTSPQGDRFILAHEVSHHVLGHTTELYYQTRATKSAASSPHKRYGFSISDDHLDEFEADALGLWLSMKRGLKESDLPQVFAALRKIPYLRTGESTSHPSLSAREQLLTQQLARQQNQPGHSDKQYESAHKSFAANDSVPAEPVNPVRDDVYKAYAFLITHNKALFDSSDTIERAHRDTLIRRARFFLDPVVSGQVAQPVLFRNGTTVSASANRSLIVGLRVGFGPWFRPQRVEIDLLVGLSVFRTYKTVGTEQIPVEQFQTTYLYARPRYVWSWLAHQSKRGYQTGGWMATAGVSVGLPLRFRYANTEVVAYQPPRQRAALGPIAGMGYGWSSWDKRKGHWRVWLMYQPQLLRFSSTSPDPIRATLHTLSLEASVRFW